MRRVMFLLVSRATRAGGSRYDLPPYPPQAGGLRGGNAGGGLRGVTPTESRKRCSSLPTNDNIVNNHFHLVKALSFWYATVTYGRETASTRHLLSRLKEGRIKGVVFDSFVHKCAFCSVSKWI